MKTTAKSKALMNRKMSDSFHKSSMAHSHKELMSDMKKRQGSKFVREGGKMK